MKDKAAIKSFRDLDVWREAMKLAELCYARTVRFPSREMYGLTSQIRRAAVSIASNIAEGHSRRTRHAFLNHLSIALGSQSEIETQIELSRRLKLMPEDEAEEILLKAGQVGRMLHALMAALERSRSRTQPPVPSP